MKNKTLDDWFDDYKNFKFAYGLSTVNTHIIQTFVNWCHRSYPDELYLTQQMINEWSLKRETEKTISQVSRTSPLNDFIRFINNRGGEFSLAEQEYAEHSPAPRQITEVEFRNILKAADEIKTVDRKNKRYKEFMALALELPIQLRLLYSSGMRPSESRLLDRKDVDLENGLIYIRKGKGYNEHLIALDPEMNQLLTEYDTKMDSLMPERIPFFPNRNGKYRSSNELAGYWRKLRDKYNEQDKDKPNLVIYSLRHNYVTKNIERLPQDGVHKDIRVLAISRSVGHKTIDTTIKHYYHLTAHSGDVLDEKMGDVFEDIMPNIEDSNENKQ